MAAGRVALVAVAAGRVALVVVAVLHREVVAPEEEAEVVKYSLTLINRIERPGKPEISCTS